MPINSATEDLLTHILYIELKKIIMSENFFKTDSYFCSTGTSTTNKLDESIPVMHI